MRNLLHKLLWLKRVLANRNTLFTVSLVLLGIGCAMERLSLGLIVPAAIVLGLCIFHQMRPTHA